MIDEILKILKNVQEKREVFKNWYVYYFPSNKKILITREGDKFMFYKNKERRSTSIFSITEIYYSKIYNLEFNLNEGDIVVDIGANIGVFSIYAARKVGKVLSFEPCLENFEDLKENIELNNAKNIFLYNKGIYSKKGKLKLYLTEEMTGHSINKQDSFSGEIEDIEVITLSDIFKDYDIEKIDFLKIDCEGSEYEVLLTTPKKCFERINRIAMELHLSLNYNFNDILSFLRKVGYRTRCLKYGGGNAMMVYAEKEIEENKNV